MISVIIPWRDRAELGTSLPANRELFERHDAEVIIVNCGGNTAHVEALVHESGLRGTRVLTVAPADFNRALCLNIGALVSKKDALFCLDADIVLVSDVFDEALGHLRTGKRYATIERIIESEPRTNVVSEPDWSFLSQLNHTKEYITTDGRRAVLRSTMVAGSHPGDGLILLKRDHMYAVGGLNASFTGWGFEDTDLQLRLQFLLGLERLGIGRATHLTHAAPSMESIKWRQNLQNATRNYGRGCFIGTLEQNRKDWLTSVAESP